MANLRESSPSWKVGDYVGLIGGLAGFAGVIVAILTWIEAAESRKIAADAQAVSQKSYDRSAGKIGAKFEFIGFTPETLKMRTPKFYKEGLRIKSLDHLKAVEPRLIVKNTGEVVIETLRVEVRTLIYAIPLLGNSDARAMAIFPGWRLSQSEREDYQLSTKLLPGRKAGVPVARSLVSQLLQNKDLEDEDLEKGYYGRFEIRVYARIAGASAFDEAERGAKLIMNLEWVPKDIGKDSCEKFLEAYRPSVEIWTGK